ncbi:MAG: dienelactone hydrolase family protein [Alphaproteobacteria bacterium]|nr:dienelactone hydrolase family protein [Alphaproteobacteria bacterium]
MPAEAGPFPGLVLLHGSDGGWSGWSDRDAVFFAGHGFAAYPLRYSIGGSPWVAGDIRDVAPDRTVACLEAMRAAPFCSGRVGLFGVSRGGEHALLVTALAVRDGAATADAVAVHAPSDVVCGAFVGASARDIDDPARSTWDPADLAWTWRGRADGLLPATPIEIERFPGPLFVSYGSADQVWSAECSRRLERRLLAAGRTPEIHCYDGQGHGLDIDAGNTNMARLLDFFVRHLTET